MSRCPTGLLCPATMQELAVELLQQFFEGAGSSALLPSVRSLDIDTDQMEAEELAIEHVRGAWVPIGFL